MADNRLAFQFSVLPNHQGQLYQPDQNHHKSQTLFTVQLTCNDFYFFYLVPWVNCAKRHISYLETSDRRKKNLSCFIWYIQSLYYKLTACNGNSGCRVFKPGLQNWKDFCLRINIPKGNYWILKIGVVVNRLKLVCWFLPPAWKFDNPNYHRKK